ncbi:MAG: GNAT family N-acetyltransferase [Solobacterium sp.]|nr:GNAT family N-acetyltransferase [Solobacterium sp.]
MISLNAFPINYEVLNDLYAHCDQRYCLNAVSVPLEEESTRAYFLGVRTGVLDGKRFYSFSVDLNQTLIGKIELSIYPEGIGEVDLILRSEETGKGYGTDTMKQLLEKITKESLCEEVYAYVHDENEAMKRLLEHTGFHEGRTFVADVMTPDQGMYRLTSVKGKEYRWSYEGAAV